MGGPPAFCVCVIPSPNYSQLSDYAQMSHAKVTLGFQKLEDDKTRSEFYKRRRSEKVPCASWS